MTSYMDLQQEWRDQRDHMDHLDQKDQWAIAEVRDTRDIQERGGLKEYQDNQVLLEFAHACEQAAPIRVFSLRTEKIHDESQCNTSDCFKHLSLSLRIYVFSEILKFIRFDET